MTRHSKKTKRLRRERREKLYKKTPIIEASPLLPPYLVDLHSNQNQEPPIKIIKFENLFKKRTFFYNLLFMCKSFLALLSLAICVGSCLLRYFPQKINIQPLQDPRYFFIFLCFMLLFSFVPTYSKKKYDIQIEFYKTYLSITQTFKYPKTKSAYVESFKTNYKKIKECKYEKKHKYMTIDSTFWGYTCELNKKKEEINKRRETRVGPLFFKVGRGQKIVFKALEECEKNNPHSSTLKEKEGDSYEEQNYNFVSSPLANDIARCLWENEHTKPPKLTNPTRNSK